MRRSPAELEQAFAQEIHRERSRRRSLMKTSAQRAQRRETDRRHRHGSMRFVALTLTLILTAVLVAVVMFRTLFLLLS
jgi:hypothetical protein